MLDVKNLRREYLLRSLNIDNLYLDPFMQFKLWFQEVQNAQVLEPNAMTLATASIQAKPSSRVVLLKGFDTQGFVFFTSYESRKAHELKDNPLASMTFLWKELERQVTIEGTVIKVSKEESQTYFHSRPRFSQLAAYASHQGHIISSRQILEEEFNRWEREYAGKEIPLPPYWGGYRLIPDRFEFWQGRLNRLHDRFQYLRKDHQWQIDRLSP